MLVLVGVALRLFYRCVETLQSIPVIDRQMWGQPCSWLHHNHQDHDDQEKDQEEEEEDDELYDDFID